MSTASFVSLSPIASLTWLTNNAGTRVGVTNLEFNENNVVPQDIRHKAGEVILRIISNIVSLNTCVPINAVV